MNTTAQRSRAAGRGTQERPAPSKQEWVSPSIECYETRPEVTAYAGDGGPWNLR